MSPFALQLFRRSEGVFVLFFFFLSLTMGCSHLLRSAEPQSITNVSPVSCFIPRSHDWRWLVFYSFTAKSSAGWRLQQWMK